MTQSVPTPEVPLSGPGGLLKEVIDRYLAILGLAVLAPLFAVIALGIRVDSSGPVFYRDARIGRDGKVFRIYKFRTMVDGSEHIGLGRNVSRDDERITRTGKWLRRTSVDEIPQLLNVALGQMSIVGPRPAPRDHIAHYTDHERRRLEVRPGITGWAQVNGRNSLRWTDRIELDIWYIDHWSPLLDLRILIRTPRALMRAADLYGPGGVTTNLRDSLDQPQVQARDPDVDRASLRTDPPP